MKVDANKVNQKIKLFESLSDNFKKDIVAGRLRTGKQSYLLACMPKSGSTWFKNIFSSLPYCCYQGIVPTYVGREQEIDAHAIDAMMQLNCGFHTISQHHVKYNANTRNCLVQFCMQPIVLTRDIRDNLVSLVDHWRREDCDPMFSAYVERGYFSNDFSSSVNAGVTPLEYAVTLHAPWIINFYLSWKKISVNPAGKLPNVIAPVFISYEELVAQTTECVAKSLSQVGLLFEESEVDDAVIKTVGKQTRKNKGIVGRGHEWFDKDKGAAEALGRILRLYNHEDLTGIGIK